MCIFKALHRDKSKQHQDLGLTLEEFMHFYDILSFKWTQVDGFIDTFEYDCFANLFIRCLETIK